MRINGELIIGLDNEPNSYFSRRGCDNCGTNLGNDVFRCKANIKAEKWESDHFSVDLCQSCLMAYHYADPLEDDCKNKFSI